MSSARRPPSIRRRVLLWIALALIALLAGQLVAGLLAPDRYEAHVSAVLARTPEEVWAALRDYRSHPMSDARPTSVTTLTGVEAKTRLPAWVEETSRCDRVAVHTLEAERPRRAVRELRSETRTSRWSFTLAERPDGCRIDIDATTTTPGGVLIGFDLSRSSRLTLLLGGLQRSVELYLDRIAGTLGVEPRYL